MKNMQIFKKVRDIKRGQTNTLKFLLYQQRKLCNRENSFEINKNFVKKYLTIEALLRYNIKVFKRLEQFCSIIPYNSLKLWKEGMKKMPKINVVNGNIEDAIKKLKRQNARNGLLQELRKRECYEKPSVKRKKKSEAARKRKY